MYRPKAIGDVAVLDSTRPRSCASATTTAATSPTSRTSRPVSTVCHASHRCSRRPGRSRPHHGLHDAQRRDRVVMVLGGQDLVTARLRGLLQLPAVAVERGDERVDDLRVELRSRAPAQLVDGVADPGRLPVGAGGGHRVERVGHGDDPRELGNLVPGESHRIAAAVHPLMVVHDPGQRLVQEADLPDDLQAPHRMQLDGGVLLLGEAALLLQHLGRHAELADVMQHPGEPHRLGPVGPHADLPRDHARRRGKPARCGPWCRSPWSPPPGRAPAASPVCARCCSANWPIAHRATYSGTSTIAAADGPSTAHSAAMTRPSAAKPRSEASSSGRPQPGHGLLRRGPAVPVEQQHSPEQAVVHQDEDHRRGGERLQRAARTSGRSPGWAARRAGWPPGGRFAARADHPALGRPSRRHTPRSRTSRR